jgi:hypothetical protein
VKENMAQWRQAKMHRLIFRMFSVVGLVGLLVSRAHAAAAQVDSSGVLSITRAEYRECVEAGRRDGQLASSGGAFGIGLGSGFLFGPVGTAFAVAFQGNPPRPALAAYRTSGPVCNSAYVQSYESAGRHRKRMMALSGGAIGTLVWLLVLLDSGQ